MAFLREHLLFNFFPLIGIVKTDDDFGQELTNRWTRSCLSILNQNIIVEPDPV